MLNNTKSTPNFFLRNLASGIGSQVFTVACNFFAVPFLLYRLGVEAYGLVAFYATLQAAFSVLDAGFSPLIIRETAARSFDGTADNRQYSALIGVLRSFFVVTALFGGALLFIGANFLAATWLNLNELDVDQVALIIQTMALIIGLRWMAGFYRALFIGHQNIVVVSIVNILMAALKFLLVIVYLDAIDGGVMDFFEYQLYCSVFEVALLYALSAKFNIYDRDRTSISEKVAAIRNNYKFAMHAGLASIIWLVLTQADKAIVSRTFTLEEFSTFSVGVLGASIFLFLSAPLSSALIPKLTEINVKQGAEAFKKFYNLTLNLCSVILVPIALFVFMFAEEFLYLWTRNLELSKDVGLILGLYSIGNVLAVVASFVYFLQSAKGNLKLHFFGSVGFLLIFIPVLMICIVSYGMNGAAMAWMVVNLLMFLLWGAYIHNIYLKKFFLSWLVRVFVPIVFFSFLLVYSEYLIFSLFANDLVLVLVTPIFCTLNMVFLYLYLYGLNTKPLKRLVS